MLLIGRLKLVKCSLLVVMWLVAKPKLLIQKKSVNGGGDEAGSLNRATCTDVVTKSRTTLYFLQQMFATIENLICCKTSLKVGDDKQNRYLTRFAAMLKNKLYVFVAWPFYHRVKLRMYDFVQHD